MAKTTNKYELRNYILRRLGSPVINVEVDDMQVDDQIDDALGMFLEHHYAGYEEVYIKYEMKQEDEDRQYIILPDSIVSVVELIEPKSRYTSSMEPLNNFKYLFLQSSYWSYSNVDMAHYWIFKQRMADFSYVFDVTRQFEFNYVSHKLIPRSRINVNDYKEKIVDISESPAYIDIEHSTWATTIDEDETVWIEESTNNNGEYTVTKVEGLGNSPDVTRVYLDGSPGLVSSPIDGKLHFKQGNFVVIRAYKMLDGEESPDLYNNWWVRDFATALTKKQWAINLKKFEGIEMPGGVRFNGQRLYEEATQELEELEERLLELEEPPHFFMG